MTIATDLRALLGTSRVLDAPAELRTYAYDASFLTQLAPRSPDAVVIADSTADVSTVLRYANQHRIPVTPRGAATGQAAGAVALGGGVVLALNAMNRVLEIDVANMQVFCEPGVVHAQLNAVLALHGLVFPPDPGSSRMATVGGMAATNAHGMRAVKYGPTSAWVLGLEVVLPDGEVIETGSVGSRAKQSSAGLELTKLIVGAEGTLGVITRLRLKLMAIPPARAIVLGLFDALEQAGQAVQAVFGAGVSPSAIEILDERCIQAINLYRPAMDLPSVEALILFEVDGNPPGVRWDAERITEVIAPFAQRTEWSDEPGRINALWEARSVVGAAVGMLRPGSNRAYCGEDICVPVARIPETLRAIQDISARHRIPIATYGHIGGGGLHPGHLIDGRDPDEIQRVLRVADDIHQLALRMGGTTTGEHGVGAARAPYMAQEHGPALEVMRRLKQALDPNRIMNPGVIFDPLPLPFELPLAGPVGEPVSSVATLDPGQSLDFPLMATTEQAEFVPATDELLYERRGAVALLTFNRPQARNALTWAMYEGLFACCEHVDADDRVKVLVLRGAGEKAFVAGTDISQFRAFSTPEDALTYERNNNRYASRLESLTKPAIAMIRGACTGGGAAFALCCDMRLTSPDVRFGVPIARTLGNILSMQNFVRLVSLIGPARTKDLIFTARLIGAEEGRSIGIFNEIVEPERLEARTLELAEQIAGNAPLTIRAAKMAVQRIVNKLRLEEAEDLVLMCYMSEDFREGVAAFMEKRPPQWQGR